MRRLLPLLMLLVACAPQEGAYSSYDLVIQCEDMVRERLKAPSTAVFEASVNAKQAQVSETASGLTYAGWVDAQNSFGATTRTTFTCAFDRSTDEVSVNLD